MAKKSDKKTIIILLIILAISIIGGGVWTYNTLKPLDEPGTYLEDSDLTLTEVFAIKRKIIQNIEYFLEPSTSSQNIWDDLYTDEQFHSLEDIDTNIDIDNYANNPDPFVVPTPLEL